MDFQGSSDKQDVVSEYRLWEKFRQGSEIALTEIYRLYADKLYNYGCQFTTDTSLVRDCIQDLFLELIRSKENLSPTDSIRFYLFRSLRNGIVHSLQKGKLRTQKETDSIAADFNITFFQDTEFLHDQEDLERKQLIRSKLDLLPSIQREAVLLYFYEGLSYQQIADLLGSKRKSAQSLIYRAIKLLGDNLLVHRHELISLAIFLVIPF